MIFVNGTPLDAGAEPTIRDVLLRLDIDPDTAGIAVAVDPAPRARACELAAGGHAGVRRVSPAERLVKRFEAAWSAADLARELADTCAPDLHYEDPLTFQARSTVPAHSRSMTHGLRTAAPASARSSSYAGSGLRV